MAVHFKFRSAVEYDSVNIDGHFISIANLKEKIVQQKSLGKGTDFDLVITNAQTGEEYTDDNQFVPKNTSIIIRRVPATRSKPTLLVPDQTQSDDSDQTSAIDSKGVDGLPLVGAVSNADLDGMDDFGVDLYSVPDTAPTHVDTDENNKILAMVNKTALDWQRQTQEAVAGGRGYGRGVYGRGFARGRGYGRAVPPPNYVCHRCGQPGHFIQHCPTNGDPAFDMKRMKLPVGIPKARLKADQEGSYIMADGSVAAMQPDDTVFAKEADALLFARPTPTEPPSELRCPVCQGIFNEAVMIPCCHYSFCDKCIRQALIEKGECPQCESTKFRNDDLLPNIALRQAINRFLEAQIPATSVEDILKQHVPDVESATRAKASSPALSCVKTGACKTAATHNIASGAEIAEKEHNPATITESFCESVVGSREKITVDVSPILVEVAKPSAPVNTVRIPDVIEAIEGSANKEKEDVADRTVVKGVSRLVREGKQPVIHIGEGAVVSKMSGAPSQKEADGLALESDVSKGKKKKRRARQMPADGIMEQTFTGKLRKGDRCCYVCGSPDHLARECPENSGPFNPQRAMFQPAGGIPPYGPEMYWHGPPMPHVRPFPMGYGEGMYGPGPMGIPFEVPIMPVGPYGVSPYIPSMYHNAAMHPGFIGGIGPGMVVPVERPLSREEFMELQERERRRRSIQERQEREHSQERSFSRGGGGQTYSPEFEQKLCDQQRVFVDERESISRKRELDQHSVRNYSDETDHHRSKSSKHSRKNERLSEIRGQWANEAASDDEIADDLKSWRLRRERQQRDLKATSSELRKESRHHHQVSAERLSSELEDGEQSYSVRGRGDGEQARLSKQSNSKRREDSMLKRHADASFRRHDDVSSKKYDRNKFKKYDVLAEVVSGEGSHLSHHRSRSQDSRHVSHSERRDVWQIGNYNEDLEERERRSIRDFSDYDIFIGKDDEKNKRRKQQSYSKCKIDADIEYASEDEINKKKKKKHKRYQESSSQERFMDVKCDFVEDIVHEPSIHRKQMFNTASQLLGSSMGKSKNSFQLAASSMEDPIEESRWQMDSGLDDGKDSSHHSHRLRHRNQLTRSGNFT